jgi:hypothetical protein
MWLQATLTAQDLQDALAKITPLRVPLDSQDPDRCLWLGKPSEVTLREADGVRISTRGQVRWDVAGITVPITLRTLGVVLTPTIEQLEGEEALTFTLRVTDADLSAVPGFLEDTIIAKVNDALARPDAKLVWRFLQTLDFTFDLPATMEPKRHMSLFARWGAVRVTDEALNLVVSWGLDAAQNATTAELVPPGPVLGQDPPAELMSDDSLPTAREDPAAPRPDPVELQR